MKTRKKSRIISLGLAILLIVHMFPMQSLMAAQQTKSEENGTKGAESVAGDCVTEDIEIYTVDDFLAFAHNCSIDSWSVDKRIILKADIDLTGSGFQMVPVFAGTFDGLGHTISGLDNADSGYIVGLFRYIQKEGVVQNLKLKGNIAGTDEKECIGSICGVNYGMIKNCSFKGNVSGRDTVGGIAGINESTGTITGCTTEGRIIGYYTTGGVAGNNHGVITYCSNRAGINDDSEWVEEDDEIGTGIFFSLTVSDSDADLYSGVDTGGIAGYSDGIISRCTNYGRVGYEHTGYNIGGIAGRQAGVVSLCTNNGEVYGRKDVGGIVGQMEPYIEVDEAESLRNAVNKLHDLIDKTIDDLQAGKDVVKTDLDYLNSYSDAALESGDALAEQMTDFVDDNIDQTQAITERMEHVVDLLPDILEDVSDAGDAFARLNDVAKQMAEDLDIIGKLDDSPYDETDYRKVTLLSTVGGELTCDNINPAENDTITITAVPDEGYKLTGTPTVTDANGNTVAIVKTTENNYTVVMPAANIKVAAYFTYDEASQPDSTSVNAAAYTVNKHTAEETDDYDEALTSLATLQLEPENMTETAESSEGKGGSVRAVLNEDNDYTIELKPDAGYELAEECLKIELILSGMAEPRNSAAEASYNSIFSVGFNALADEDLADMDTSSKVIDDMDEEEDPDDNEDPDKEGDSDKNEDPDKEGDSDKNEDPDKEGDSDKNDDPDKKEDPDDNDDSDKVEDTDNNNDSDKEEDTDDKEEDTAPGNEASDKSPQKTSGIITIRKADLGEPVNGVYTYKLSADDYDADAIHVTASFVKADTLANTEYTITKNAGTGGKIIAPEKAAADGKIPVTVTPSDGYMLSSVSVKTETGNPVDITKEGDGKIYYFTMPNEDVVIEAEFTRINLILSSNLSGSASYSGDSNGVVTLNIRPDTAYTLAENPVVTDANGKHILISRRQSGSYVYEFNISGAAVPCRVTITFQTQNKKQAVDTSRQNISDDLNELQEASNQVDQSMSRINNIMTDDDGAIREWNDLSSDEQDEVLREIANLSEYLGDMSTAASSVLSNLGVIGNILSPYVSDAMEAAKRDIEEATDQVQSIIGALKDATSGVKGIVNYINAQPDIQFSKLGEEFDANREDFHNQLQGISDSLKSLSDHASDYSDIINDDLRAVNDQLNIVFNLMTDHLFDYNDISVEELYEEVTDDEIETITTGRTDDCVNKGIVKGDINIGGIAGAMSIDEEDPEDSAAGNVEYEIGRRFITKCIITGSVNEGYITAKKDGAGGIVGYMKHGVVLDSEGYGSVESTEGDYVGGICGESLTVIKRCYALCSVSGNKNVGGIAGYADELKDCYAIVTVEADSGKMGAIAGQVTSYENTHEDGEEAAKVSGNYYVGDTLYGIDNISYVGIAEPISYEELLTVEKLPTEFWHLKVIYRIDDTNLGSEEIEFGESLAGLQYPTIPEKEGYYGVWPDYSKERMKGNLVINGVYKENITVVESSEKNMESAEGAYQKPYALVEQIFTEDTVLKVAVSNMTPPKEALGQEYVIYDISLENSGIDDTNTFAVRILNPYEDATVWGYRDGAWIKLESKSRGQYLQVDMVGSKEAFCIIENKSDKFIIIGAAAATAVFFIILIVMIKKIKARRQKRRLKNAENKEGMEKKAQDE